MPFFIIYRKQAVPYFIALVQHGLVGDCIAGRVQLFWPISRVDFGIGLSITGLTNQTIEWTMFLAAIMLYVKMKDYREFSKPKTSNLVLIIPTTTVLLPTLLNIPIEVPALLIPPHLFYLIVFVVAILIEARALLFNYSRAPATENQGENKNGVGYDDGGGLVPRINGNCSF